MTIKAQNLKKANAALEMILRRINKIKLSKRYVSQQVSRNAKVA